jgi:hypothetical protein
MSFKTDINCIKNKKYDRLSVKKAPEIFRRVGINSQLYDDFCKKHGLYDVPVHCAVQGVDELEMQEQLEARFE